MRFSNLLLILLALWLPASLCAAPKNSVSITENDTTFTLDNGLVTAQVAKHSGDLLSLRYQNLELLDPHSGRPAGYWSHNAARGVAETRITIDPQTNGGRRGEVSVKGIANGNPLGSGPGGSVTADIEIRYSLGRGEAGVYTYAIFTHPTNYPATSIGEARFCLKLNDDLFDWMTVDTNRNLKMISTYEWNHGTQMNFKEGRLIHSGPYQGQVEHKYDYAANQFAVRAWGWSSSARHVGLWLVNPSVEYLSGGPTKFELSSHRDATFNTNNLNAPAAPTLLNYWRSSHYGGSICNIAATDAWTKVVGPFLIYCNSGNTPNAMWHNALTQSEREAKAWPFDWVNGVDYPHKDARGIVTGKIVLHDPQAPDLRMKNLLVGLTAPDYAPAVIPRPPRADRGGNPGGGFGLAGGGDDEAAMTNQNFSITGGTNDELTATNISRRTGGSLANGGNRGGTNRFRGGGSGGLPRMVDWQNDAKNYQFWVRARNDGSFTILNVRAGTYTLHAIADGVLGDLTVTNLTVAAGKKLTLGKIAWQPVRYGRQLWDIGIPNRTGAEFFKGDQYFHWGWYLQYPKLFPYDVKYVIGKSDYRQDWFFEQVPYNDDTNNVTGTGRGSGTTWTVRFSLTNTPHGLATLRLPICGVGARNLTVYMNDQIVGMVTNLTYNGTINRDGIGGYWQEHNVSFDAAQMKAGSNLLELSIPPGPLTSGLIYDYLRLELDEHSSPQK